MSTGNKTVYWGSKIISYFAQPLLMPSLGYAIMLFGFPHIFAQIPIITKLYLWAFVMVITLVMPVVGILILRFLNVIHSLEMHSRSERQMPLLLTAFIYLAYGYLLYTKYNFDPFFSGVMLGMAILVLLVGFINLFWKISAHSAGVSALVMMLFVMNIFDFNRPMFLLLLAAIVFAGFVMAARLYLKEHDFLQIIAGSLLGGLVSTCTVWYFY